MKAGFVPAPLLLAVCLFGAACGPGAVEDHGAGLPPELTEDAARIVEAALADDAAYERLSEFCDRFGPRPAGSEALEHALHWAVETMNSDGMENVRLEPVTLTGWFRGEERLTLLEPSGPRTLPLLGLGRSVGTAEGGITAPLLVVADFDELDRVGEKARGKIVLFNFPMKSQPVMFRAYGEAVAYRWRGAEEAARHGAVAALVRSVTTRSLGTPHTGAMKPYSDEVAAIPAAAVTVEDAAMLARLSARGEKIVLRLEMGATSRENLPSANAVGELRGRERPEEVVVIGGHIDSWDVGQGAHDDGSGVIFSIEALRLLKQLDLQPRRTIRAVLFTNEEKGLDGGKGYLAAHENELARHVAALESDSGGFHPVAFGFAGSDTAAAILERWLPLFESVGPMTLHRGGSGADISPIVKRGVPGVGLYVDSTHYFDYHHSAADTVDKVVPADFKRSLAAFTLMSWLLAENPDPLPRAPAE